MSAEIKVILVDSKLTIRLISDNGVIYEREMTAEEKRIWGYRDMTGYSIRSRKAHHE